MDEQLDQSRRAILRAATGAFALAASGLMLPMAGELPEASAATGVESEGQGKNRRKRQRRRRRNAMARILDVALSIHNFRSEVIVIHAWTDTGKYPFPWVALGGPHALAAKPQSGPESSVEFVENVDSIGVGTGDHYVINVFNPAIGYPGVQIGTGDWGALGWEPQGETLLSTGLAEGETARISGFEAKRLNDTATHKQFQVNLV
jgi:hypothetical protein